LLGEYLQRLEDQIPFLKEENLNQLSFLVAYVLYHGAKQQRSGN
jgi:hypothetical protein